MFEHLIFATLPALRVFDAFVPLGNTLVVGALWTWVCGQSVARGYSARLAPEQQYQGASYFVVCTSFAVSRGYELKRIEQELCHASAHPGIHSHPRRVFLLFYTELPLAVAQAVDVWMRGRARYCTRGWWQQGGRLLFNYQWSETCLYIDNSLQKGVKLLKKIMYCSVALLLIFLMVFALDSDDPLTSLADRWLKQKAVDRASDSAAFVYLLGMEASADVSVEAYGLQRMAELRDLAHLVDPPARPSLSKPVSKNLYCNPHEASCIDSILAGRARWPALLAQNAVLLERYERFLRFDDYRVFTPLGDAIPFADYSYLLAGNALQRLRILALAEAGEIDAAAEMLHTDISALRRQLVIADDLIYKLVIAGTLGHDLEWMAWMHAAHELPNAQTVAFLNTAERSLEKPMVKELFLVYQTLKELDGNANALSNEQKIPVWLVKRLFKANRTVNLMMPNYTRPITLSTVAQAELPELFEQEFDHGLHFQFLNPIGSVLASLTGQVAYDRYVARIADINVKIGVLNWLLSDRAGSASNPYYPADKEKPWAEGGLYCLRTPALGENAQQCIRGDAAPH